MSLSARSIVPSLWVPLAAELDAWTAAGRTAGFWWRDDDAIAPTAALDRLLALAGDRPLALAVIPGQATEALAHRLETAGPVSVLQHGIDHRNHAAPSAKKAELAGDRPASDVAAELTVARDRLQELFGRRSLPVLVPPWNRIATDLVALLPAAGFIGLSTAAPRRSAHPAPGLLQVNSHIDPVDWHGTRRCRPQAEVLAGLVDHLAARRLGTIDGEEPTGLLTHHLLDDPATERFMADLAALLDAHPAAAWPATPEIWPA